MSFDVFLYAFRDGEVAETDRDAVNAVLARHPHESPAEFGYYRVYFDDVDTEFNGDGLDGKEPFTSCAFHIRGLCPELITFVFDVSKAGNMVIFNAQGEDTPERPVMIYSHPEQAQHVPKDMYKNPALCTSGEHLWNMLFEAYQGWTDYRDQVTHRP